MKTVFFDIDTQRDFVYPAGALYVPGAEKILPVVAWLNRYAAGHAIPLISTADAHSENDAEFRDWPPHCVKGTHGQHKAAGTLIEQHSIIPTSPGPLNLAPQVIVEKQALDCFTNVNLPPLLDALGADRYVVYGVVTEFCVRSAVFGLLRTGRQVEVVADAIRSLSEDASRAALDEFIRRGARLTTAAELCL
jgi:nicotinamidase/pyrazinamidase